MRKLLPIIILIFIRADFSLFGENNLIERFLPEFKAVPALPSLEIPLKSGSRPSFPVSVEEHNRAVRLNDEGIEALEKNNLNQAISRFLEACEADSNEPIFFKNLITALKRASRHQEVVNWSLRLLEISPNDFQANFDVGNSFANFLNKPREGLPYLEFARRLHPEDTRVALASVLAFEKAGYDDQAIEILKGCAGLTQTDPYPMYVLGKILLKKGEFPSALRAFKSVLPLDSEGYVHEIYVRTRFFAGELDGLKNECQNVLDRFPQIINRPILEKILSALSDQRVKFREDFRVHLSDSKTLKELKFLINLIPSIEGLQKVSLEKAEIISRSKVKEVFSVGKDRLGKAIFVCPEEMFSENLVLRLTYEITSSPCLENSRFFPKNPRPDIYVLQSGIGAGLNDSRLHELFSALSRIPGDPVRNFFSAIGRGLRYQENSQIHPISWILENPDKCDCTEFALLFAALCLKKGLPARVMSGFLLRPESKGKETFIGHAWTEIYFPEKGWLIFDPTLGATMHFAYFGNKLSDQILFGDQEDGSPKACLDVSSFSPQMKIELSTSFSYW